MFEPSSCPVQDTPSASGDDSQATSGNETPDYPSNDAPASTDSDVPSATGDEVPETTGDDIQAAAAASVSYDYNATPYSPTDNEADAYPGKYNENPIISNDPDKGQFAYHRGIQVSWKDDVTQQNVTMGELHNGRDKDGNLFVDALLNNLGDIVLVPGKLYNWGVIVNESGANIYACDATEAIIPIEPPTPISTITSKRITLEPPVANLVENWGTIINRGGILPASVELLDNTGFARSPSLATTPSCSSSSTTERSSTTATSTDGTSRRHPPMSRRPRPCSTAWRPSFPPRQTPRPQLPSDHSSRAAWQPSSQESASGSKGFVGKG